MKKITNKFIAEKIGVARQTVSNWESNKPQLYEAVRGYFFLKENNFFEKIKKIKALADLIYQECDSKYAKDLKTLADEAGEIIEFLEKEKNETCNCRKQNF